MVLRIEDISFIGIYINDSFRDFKDINDYANYHVSLLNNKRYQAFSGGDFIDRVVKGGYATDPNYKKALSNVYNQIAKAQEGMKIPKLQNAGELKARILRQFNKEKAANRNEEQLIGFDWSRYKSNKPKPETTPTQSEQLENGGVIKAQDGIIAQAINKVKSFLPKEEPKEPVDVVDIIKEYAPSAATSFLSGSVNPFINKLLEGKKSSLDYSHKFGSTGNKFEEFASVMTPIFKEALEENGLPITNLNNLVRQAALESNYGLDPRGERGFNLSGIKHPGDSIAPKYKKSRYKDGFDYIDFDNLKDYANYKVKVLNDRYKALDAKDTNDFIDRLHGNNSGKYNYSADKDSYRRNLNGTLSLNKYLKRGGILKYQNPSSGIQRRDAIKDYRPQIQEPIKQQYTPTYSEISQDNRSEWEKSQSREKADKAYKDYMQAKNTEEAIRTLDGLATMSDYIGLGAGVGSIIGRGLKYAGKRIGKKVTEDFIKNQRLGVVSPQFRQSNKFKSELDWSPKSWFEEAGQWKDYTKSDIDALKSHIPEYYEIERASKANETWLNLPNGGKWKGDPRTWVQLMSKDGQKLLMPHKDWRVGVKPWDLDKSATYNGKSWMSDNPEVYNSFANKKGYAYYDPSLGEGEAFALTIPKSSNVATVNAKGNDFARIPFGNSTIDSDQLVHWKQQGGYDATLIKDVIEGPHVKQKTVSNNFIIHEGTPRKSIVGNNGNFDLNNKNIYRGLIPFGVAGGMNYGNK